MGVVAMTIDRQIEAEIRRLFFCEHWKKGTSAEQLGLHHDVVDRVVGPHGPSPKNKGPRPSVLDAYHGFVLKTLGLYPTLASTCLYDMIVERGYTGSIRTLRRFVLLNRPVPTHEVYLRIETLAGEQSQIDWAHVGKLRVSGGVRPLYCFVLVLRYSRAIWAEFVLEQTTASLLRSLVRAAQYFGGVTHEWLFDYVARHIIEEPPERRPRAVRRRRGADPGDRARRPPARRSPPGPRHRDARRALRLGLPGWLIPLERRTG
ncbi:hypothetical protein [Sorangium sp. So ce124]|uniref:hypothetical protein n=1 Tax=Sorangium sp. So ce124 TaxID=3133280 RepID=UPI003F5EEC72